jgi:secondary thiamine-phosphate synthase enzyme
MKSIFEVKTTSKEEVLDITGKVSSIVAGSGVEEGICYVFVPHTTAGITINENADPDVKKDLLRGFDAMVPRDIRYDHSEGIPALI